MFKHLFNNPISSPLTHILGRSVRPVTLYRGFRITLSSQLVPLHFHNLRSNKAGYHVQKALTTITLKLIIMKTVTDTQSLKHTPHVYIHQIHTTITYVYIYYTYALPQ